MVHEVIMPALGMAQETGVVLVWRKAQGDEVKAGEVLMEVETDKAAMEVEAQASGFLTEIRAGEGVEVPVGEVIAIISQTAAAVTETPRLEPQPAAATPPAPVPPDAEAKTPERPPSAAKTVNGRVLASPKAKRLASESGLDLSRLVKAGHSQPFHAADLEILAAMPASDSASRARSNRIMGRASVAADRFDEFCRWVETETDTNAGVILAAFAAGSLRSASGAASLTVLLTAPRKQERLYANPDMVGFGRVTPMDAQQAADLIVFDLTGTRLTDAELAAANVPTMTVARDGGKLAVTLSACVDQLDDEALIDCLDGFVGRLDEPLRQLI